MLISSYVIHNILIFYNHNKKHIVNFKEKYWIIIILRLRYILARMTQIARLFVQYSILNSNSVLSINHPTSILYVNFVTLPKVELQLDIKITIPICLWNPNLLSIGIASDINLFTTFCGWLFKWNFMIAMDRIKEIVVEFYIKVLLYKSQLVTFVNCHILMLFIF